MNPAILFILEHILSNTFQNTYINKFKDIIVRAMIKP